ncbi:MAG: oligosaccharide flippase family protein [Pseudomonadota bacterium]
MWQFVHLGLGGILMIILWIILGRNWSVELFGYFNYFFAYISIVGIFFDFGMDVLLIKLLSKGAQAIPENCWKLKQKVFFVVVFFSTIIAYLLEFPLDSLLFLMAGITLLSFSSYFNSIFRARDVLYIEAKIGLLQKILFIGVSLIGVIYYNQGILCLAIAYFISHLLAFILTLRILYKKDWLLIASTSSSTNDYWQQSWPLFITALLAVLSLRIDIFLLQWITTAEQVGYYTAALRLFEGVIIISSAFIAVVFPKFVAKNQDYPALSQFYKYTQKVLTAVGMSIIIPGFLIVPAAIVLLYGEKFSPSIILLQTLVPLLVIVFLTGLAGNLLIAMGKQHQYMQILALMLGFQVISNLISINLWGTIGAIATYWVRELILLLVLSWFIKKNMQPLATEKS